MSTEIGAYFRREDYASFWIRLLVEIVDLAVVIFLCVAFTLPLAAILPSDRLGFNVILLHWIAFLFLYFVVLKGSRIRTLGYRIGRVKIVGLDGRAPGYSALTLRLAFAILSPLSILDLMWLWHDEHRQALRDKFAGTYVVKAKSEPMGCASLVRRRYEILFYNFLFREIKTIDS